MEMHERLKFARSRFFETAREAAEALGVKYGTYSGHENGLRGIKRDDVERYARRFRVPFAWLATGEGEAPEEAQKKMRKPEFRNEKAQIEVFEYDVRAGASYGGGVDAGDIELHDQSGTTIDAPVARATWVMPAAFLTGELGLSSAEIDIITIQGPSMDDGSRYSLMDGDRVIVSRRERRVNQGGIFAIWDGSGVVVKLVEPVRGTEPPRIRCSSLNTRFEPFDLVLDGNAHIIGRIAGRISRM